MGVLKVAKRSRYTVVDRATVRDVRLSFRALGILVRLLDQPDGAEVDSVKLSDHRPEGRDAVRTALRELEACGYLHRERKRVDGGKWVTVTWVLERPLAPGKQLTLDVPAPDNPASAGPASGNQALRTENPAVTNVTAKRAQHEAADGIVGRVYRARDPKPATPFTTAVGIVVRLLAAGHDQTAVEGALGRVTTVSLASLERELLVPKAKAAGKAVDQDRSQDSGRIAL